MNGKPLSMTFGKLTLVIIGDTLSLEIDPRAEVETHCRALGDATGESLNLFGGQGECQAGADDRTLGLYKKFDVRHRADPTGKHARCEYFVLDMAHDKFAMPALDAYATACENEYPQLSRDLRAAVSSMSAWFGIDDFPKQSAYAVERKRDVKRGKDRRLESLTPIPVSQSDERRKYQRRGSGLPQSLEARVIDLRGYEALPHREQVLKLADDLLAEVHLLRKLLNRSAGYDVVKEQH